MIFTKIISKIVGKLFLQDLLVLIKSNASIKTAVGKKLMVIHGVIDHKNNFHVKILIFKVILLDLIKYGIKIYMKTLINNLVLKTQVQ